MQVESHSFIFNLGKIQVSGKFDQTSTVLSKTDSSTDVFLAISQNSRNPWFHENLWMAIFEGSNNQLKFA